MVDKLGVLKKATEFWVKAEVLPKANDELLDKLASLCTLKTYEAGTIIAMEGKEANNLYLLAEGAVSIIVGLGKTYERQIQTASRFELVGWSAVVPPYSYKGSVKVEKKLTALVFNGQALRDLSQKDPVLGCVVYRWIISALSQRLHNAFLQLTNVT
jgi:CRP/FNR family cyclic AMP-dependent transcriptional regulator